ncbi:LOW QUALITY PROTEIN: protein fantom-like [Palaemon carinicauda]|uniref:LOW QUALITY PROTEIN: protein fantom-like n=1 Tax=Palaemon carinicauda TaxID=392227 RepID=UPI0035B5DB65
MTTSDEDHVPVRDGHSSHPRHTAPEEMYWLSHMNQEELRDKYVKLKDDFCTIKNFSCRQEDKIKKLQTKLRKLIADRKKDGSALESTALRIQKLEHEEVIDTLKQSIRDLKLKNEHMEKRLKLSNLQLSSAKKNKPMLFRNVRSRVDSGLKQTKAAQSPHPKVPPRPKSSPPKMSSSSEESSFILSPESVQQNDQMSERVREILEEARERIIRLERERNDLIEQITDIQQTTEDSEYDWQQKLNALEEEVTSLRQALKDRGIREERDSVAIIRAQREAHALTARSTALQEQIVITEEKVVAERSRSSLLQAELDKIHNKFTTLEHQSKEQLQELQHAKGELHQTAEKLSILKKENEQLQKENGQLTKMRLESDQRGKTTEVDSLKLQIAHLESALESDLSERSTFLVRMTQDKEEMVKLEVEAKELRTKNLELQEQLQKMHQKLELYDKAGLLNLNANELASVLSKDKERNTDAISYEEFEKLRQSHSELQLLYREKTLELERTSQALARHATTYKSLKDEIDKVNQESEKKAQSLNSTIKSLKEMIKRRDEQSDKLGQQILMLTDKSIKDKLEGLSQDVIQNVKLSKHDNMLEFHIESVSFEMDDFSQLKSFVSWTVPFSLEDPLQHTNVAIGKFAHFKYSSLYKFHMNYRNLESLRDDFVTASVYILLESGHPAKVGECQLTFCEVLEHPRNTLHGTVPITACLDDADELKHLLPDLEKKIDKAIGTLSYWFRLQRPCEKIIFQHLQNVGALSSQHSEYQLPQTVSNMIKSENPVAMRHKEKYSEGLGYSLAPEGNVVKSKEEKVIQTDLYPDAEGNPPNGGSLMGAEDSRWSKQKSNLSSDKQSKKPFLVHRKKGTSEIVTEFQETKEESLENRHSRTSSPSSTGTYNVESPSHKSPEINSPSSTGTYNIEVNTSKNADERPSSSKANDPLNRKRSLASSELKNLVGDSDVNQEEEGSGLSQSSRASSKADIAKVPPQKPPRTFVHKEEYSRPGTSKSFNTATEKQMSKEEEEEEFLVKESSIADSEGNDTMFEESASSSDSSEKSLHDKVHIKGKMKSSRNELGKDYDDDGEERQIQKVKNSRTDQLRSDSKSGLRSQSQKSIDPFSPSRSSTVSDSEGVVTVRPKKSKAKNSVIYIEVCSLTIFTDSSVMQDPLVKFLFVDYHGFLDLPPEKLETPQSLPKPLSGCALNFSFGQEFNVDEKLYPSRRKALEELMRNRGFIKFTVTSEPPEELQDTQDCQDLGYAYVNLHDLLKKGQDLQEEDLVVENAEDGSVMGSLKITIHILHVLRQLEY